jgi:hypothetical protein
VFHLGDYRRATLGPGQDVPHDYFFVNGEGLISRLRRCLSLFPHFKASTLQCLLHSALSNPLLASRSSIHI